VDDRASADPRPRSLDDTDGAGADLHEAKPAGIDELVRLALRTPRRFGTELFRKICLPINLGQRGLPPRHRRPAETIACTTSADER
jgi:hypothetical protein